MSYKQKFQQPKLDAGSTEALTKTLASSAENEDFPLTKALIFAGSVNDLLALYDLLTEKYGIDCKSRKHKLIDRTKAMSKEIRALGLGGEAKEILIAAQTPQQKVLWQPDLNKEKE